MIDWISDFEQKFGNDDEVNKLKEKKFYGYVQINFYEGKVVDINKHQTRKPTVTFKKVTDNLKYRSG